VEILAAPFEIELFRIRQSGAWFTRCCLLLQDL